MKRKLNCILFIDDDDDCNFFHRRALEKLDCCEKIETALNGKQALEFLNAKKENHQLPPDIIFLDINMPVMNGWQFLEEYQKLDENTKAKIFIMLTTSLNEDDKEKALSTKQVDGFENKYLNKAALERILLQYFDDIFIAG